MILTGVWSKLRGDMPKEVDNYTWRQKLKALLLLLPVLGLMVAVIGSIYAGWATPTESAAVGVLGALVMSLAGGSLTWNTFAQSLMGAARTTCMIGFIVGGATVLTVMFNYTGIPLTLAKAVAALDLNPYLFMFVLTAIYLVLGCVLEGISIMVLSAAIFVPVVSAMGFDLIWFGIYLVIIIEMALITPPIGFNLFVLQGMTHHEMNFIARAALPMFLIMVLMVFVLIAFPELATWLPDNIRQRPA